MEKWPIITPFTAENIPGEEPIQAMKLKLSADSYK
jgi:hypothetical protein